MIVRPVWYPGSVTVPCCSIVQTVDVDAGSDGGVTVCSSPGGDCQLAIAEGGEELGVTARGKSVGEEEPGVCLALHLPFRRL